MPDQDTGLVYNSFVRKTLVGYNLDQSAIDSVLTGWLHREVRAFPEWPMDLNGFNTRVPLFPSGDIRKKLPYSGGSGGCLNGFFMSPHGSLYSWLTPELSRRQPA